MGTSIMKSAESSIQAFVSFLRCVTGLACFAALTTGAQENHEVAADDPPLVIIGASYAESWRINSLDGHPVVNRGVGGNESNEMLARFEQDVLSLDPEVVLIWGFINDIFRSDVNKLDATKIQIRSNYTAMVEAAEERGINVILATEVSIRGQAGFVNWIATMVGSMLGKTSYQDRINGHVHDVNMWLSEYSKLNEIALLDFEYLLSDSDGNRKAEFTEDDGSHLTPAAYDAISAYSRDVLGKE